MSQLIYRVPQTQSAAHDKGSKISRLDVAFSLPLIDVIKDVEGVLTDAEGKNKGKYKDKMVKIRYVHGASTLVYDQQISNLGIPANASTTNPNGYKASPLDKINFSKGFYMDFQDDEMRSLFIKICNANGSNPHRQTKYAPMFVFVDRKKNAEAELSNDLIVFQAKTLILTDLKKDSNLLRRLGKIMYGTVDSLEDIEILNQLSKMAEKAPDSENVSGAERILTAYKTLSQDTDDVIADAERLGVINISPTKVTWNSDNTTIISYKAGGGSVAKVKLIEYLSQPENSETLDVLKNVVKEKRLEESAKLVVTT